MKRHTQSHFVFTLFFRTACSGVVAALLVSQTALAVTLCSVAKRESMRHVLMPEIFSTHAACEKDLVNQKAQIEASTEASWQGQCVEGPYYWSLVFRSSKPFDRTLKSCFVDELNHVQVTEWLEEDILNEDLDSDTFYLSNSTVDVVHTEVHPFSFEADCIRKATIRCSEYPSHAFNLGQAVPINCKCLTTSVPGTSDRAYILRITYLQN